MRNKILTFIIGMLVGAILTTVGFLIYNKEVKNDSEQPGMVQMDGNRQMGQPANGDMEEPPAKPEDSNNNVNS